jgi:hypothetical protein
MMLRGVCFDAAVVDGTALSAAAAAAAMAPGCVRVLGQSLSRGAAREYEAAQARWRAALGAARAVRTASGAEGPPPAWGRLAASLPSDAFATEEDVLRSLRKLLKLPAGEVRARARESAHQRRRRRQTDACAPLYWCRRGARCCRSTPPRRRCLRTRP